MSSRMYNKGVVVRIVCHSWAGFKRESLSNQGVRKSSIDPNLLGDGSLKLLDKKWRNKINSRHLGFRKFPQKYGHKLSGGSVYNITNENLTAFEAEFKKRQQSYQKDVLEPMKAELVTMRSAKVEAVREHSKTVFANNQAGLVVGTINDEDALPHNFVEKRVESVEAAFDKIQDDIDTIFGVEWMPHECMALVEITKEGLDILETLDDTNTDIRKKLLTLAKYNVAEIDKIHKGLWLEDISNKLASLKAACEGGDRVNGNTISSVKNFILPHVNKNYFDGCNTLCMLLEFLECILPDGQIVPYLSIDRTDVLLRVSDVLDELSKIVPAPANIVTSANEYMPKKKGKRNLEL